MKPENLLPPLAVHPEDAHGEWRAEDADRAIYRLGLHALPVPGLPNELMVGDVQVRFVRGPIRVQRTAIRQRFGLPIVFDKAMVREEIGEGELIALLSIDEEIPDDLEAAFGSWRSRALAAAGIVASILDERVVGVELFEDAILLRGEKFLGGADVQAEVRSYLPFDVTRQDRAALESLATIDIGDDKAATRAARLYRRAALEGPTADAYAMLWVAAECFSDQRTPSRKEIEAVLIEAGLDPESLPLHVGLLIDLRGEVQHFGRDIDDRLKTAYYEMEAVVRCLIRSDAEITGGWWVAPDNVAAFADPINEAVERQQGRGTTEWHGSLPPVDLDPQSLHLPRRIPKPLDDSRIEIDEAFGEGREMLAFLVIDALEWAGLDGHVRLTRGRPAGAPDGMRNGANAEEIWLSEEAVAGIPDQMESGTFVNLAWDLASLVGYTLAQQAGIVSQGDGTVLVEAIGSWVQYRRWVTCGEFDPEQLNLPAGRDRFALGKLAGWAAAGHEPARARVANLPKDEQDLCRSIIDGLRQDGPGPPLDLLGLANGTAA